MSADKEDAVESVQQLYSAATMPWSYVFSSDLVLCYVVILFSLILNSIFLKILINHRQNLLKTFLIHLLIVDLFLCIFTGIVEIVWRLVIKWSLGDAACRIFSVLKTLGVYTHSNLIISVSIMLLQIVSGGNLTVLNYAFCGRTLYAMAWLTAVVLSVPQALVFHTYTIPADTTAPDVGDLTVCINSNIGGTKLAYMTANLVMAYFVPLVITSILHLTIFYKLFCTKPRLTWRYGFNDTLNPKPIPIPDRKKDVDGVLENDADIRTDHSVPNVFRRFVAQLCAVILMTFVIGSMPYPLVVIRYEMMMDEDTGTLKEGSQTPDGLLISLALLAPLLNPICYGVFCLYWRSRVPLSFWIQS